MLKYKTKGIHINNKLFNNNKYIKSFEQKILKSSFIFFIEKEKKIKVGYVSKYLNSTISGIKTIISIMQDDEMLPFNYYFYLLQIFSFELEKLNRNSMERQPKDNEK